ncbi:hypothetical protein F4860DRAFT_483760 [Xylaria cubensis]|nr:hypothetical protein F4860DRAFT_483760 [Xylaria cubensis]
MIVYSFTLLPAMGVVVLSTANWGVIGETQERTRQPVQGRARPPRRAPSTLPSFRIWGIRIGKQISLPRCVQELFVLYVIQGLQYPFVE